MHRKLSPLSFAAKTCVRTSALVLAGLYPFVVCAGVSSGTGFFITSTGYIATNYHVIKNSTELEVRDIRGNTSPAKVIRSDQQNDLAIIKIEAKSKPLAISRSSTVRKGDSVFTIGFPNITMQGLSAKFTEGTVSSLTGLRDEPGKFQVSVPVQPGNSGGPLINKDGNVVGVVVSKLSAEAALKSGSTIPEAVNYAVKSNYLLELIDTDTNISEQIVQAPKSGKQIPLPSLVANAEPSVVTILARSPDSQGKPDAAPPPRAAGPQSGQDPNSFASLNAGVAALSNGNFSEAATHFRKAADQGNGEAMWQLSKLYFTGQGISKNPSEATRWARKSADTGSVQGQNFLAYLYETGLSGEPVNYTEALRLYRKTADQGDPGGLTGLGLAYAFGRGVPRDDAEALRLFRKAADIGYPTAQAHIGIMYELGRFSGFVTDDIGAIVEHEKQMKEFMELIRK